MKTAPFRANRVIWPQEILDKLGSAPDTVIAKSMKISGKCVTDKRNSLGIPKYRKQWDQEVIDMMGVISDWKIAEKIGSTHSSVRRKRKELGITDYRGNWCVGEVEKDLGQMSDSNLIKKYNLNLTIYGVHDERKKRGIPAFFEDEVTKVWTYEDIKLLGTDIDEVIGSKVGVSAGTVLLKRRELGINFYQRTGPIHLWGESEHRLLGTMTDYDLGILIGRTTAAVRARRVLFRIPSIQREGLSVKRYKKKYFASENI